MLLADDNTLILDPEFSGAVQFRLEKKDPKKNGVRPEIAGVIKRLKPSEIRLLAILGFEKLKIGIAAAKRLNTTPAVLLSEIQDLIQKINSLQARP